MFVLCVCVRVQIAAAGPALSVQRSASDGAAQQTEPARTREAAPH